ncbi:MAG: transposase [Nitrospira sp.]|nr:transposase [Nitrospira sp.]
MGGHGVNKRRFTEEFKEQAIKQVIERGGAVGEVANALAFLCKACFKLVKVYSPNATDRYDDAEGRTPSGSGQAGHSKKTVLS